jgi:hypothetical protein
VAVPVPNPVITVQKPPITSILEVIHAAAEKEPEELHKPEVKITHSLNSVTITISNVEGRVTADRFNAFVTTNGSNAFYNLLSNPHHPNKSNL